MKHGFIQSFEVFHAEAYRIDFGRVYYVASPTTPALNAYVYLRGKFSNLKSKQISVHVETVPDRSFGGQMLKLTQRDGSVCFYRIKVKDGKVIKGDMCMF